MSDKIVQIIDATGWAVDWWDDSRDNSALAAWALVEDDEGAQKVVGLAVPSDNSAQLERVDLADDENGIDKYFRRTG